MTMVDTILTMLSKSVGEEYQRKSLIAFCDVEDALLRLGMIRTPFKLTKGNSQQQLTEFHGIPSNPCTRCMILHSKI